MEKAAYNRQNFIQVLMQKSQKNIQTFVLNICQQDIFPKHYTYSSPEKDAKRIQILQLQSKALIGPANKHKKLIINPFSTQRISKFAQWNRKNNNNRSIKSVCDQIQKIQNNQIKQINPQFSDLNMAQMFIFKARNQLKQNPRSPQFRKRRQLKSRSIHGQPKNCIYQIPQQFYRKSLPDTNLQVVHSKKIMRQLIQSEQCHSAALSKNKQIQSPLLVRKTSDLKQSRSINKRKPKDYEQLKKNRQQIIQQQRKNIIRLKKQLKQSYGKPFNPPPNITAYSYIVYQPNFSKNDKKLKKSQGKNSRYQNSHKVHIAQNSRNTVQVASLTKIMTCILAIQMCQKYGLVASQQILKIGKFQSNIGGTSARIQPGQIYTLQQMYYGLMLPSGNDASLAIAVWGGRYLLHYQQKLYQSNLYLGPTKQSQKTQNSQQNNIIRPKYKKKECYNRFIIQMNNKAKQIGLQKTVYANSHGLVNSTNKSCSYDIAILCQHAMNNQVFKKIVSTLYYNSQIKMEIQKDSTIKNSGFLCSYDQNNRNRFKFNDQNQIDEGQQKQLDDVQDQDNNDATKIQQQKQKQYILIDKKVQWQNTHKLLHQKPKQYIGIKTGITTAAGPCLASCVKNLEGRQFIIVVLGCKRMNQRFKDTQVLKKWIYQREGLFTKKNSFPIRAPSKILNKQKGSQSQQSQDQ